MLGFCFRNRTETYRYCQRLGGETPIAPQKKPLPGAPETGRHFDIYRLKWIFLVGTFSRIGGLLLQNIRPNGQRQTKTAPDFRSGSFIIRFLFNVI